jgi:hypothetical protein
VNADMVFALISTSQTETFPDFTRIEMVRWTAGLSKHQWPQTRRLYLQSSHAVSGPFRIPVFWRPVDSHPKQLLNKHTYGAVFQES